MAERRRDTARAARRRRVRRFRIRIRVRVVRLGRIGRRRRHHRAPRAGRHQRRGALRDCARGGARQNARVVSRRGRSAPRRGRQEEGHRGVDAYGQCCRQRQRGARDGFVEAREDVTGCQGSGHRSRDQDGFHRSVRELAGRRGRR